MLDGTLTGLDGDDLNRRDRGPAFSRNPGKTFSAAAEPVSKASVAVNMLKFNGGEVKYRTKVEIFGFGLRYSNSQWLRFSAWEAGNNISVHRFTS